MSRTIGTALGDHYIGCQSHLFSDFVFSCNNNSIVYQYLWTYKGYSKSSSFWKTFEEVWCGKWMGSCHSFELYSVFGVPFQQSIAFNEIDRQISRKMIKIISNFVHKKWVKVEKLLNYLLIMFCFDSKQTLAKQWMVSLSLWGTECNQTLL